MIRLQFQFGARLFSHLRIEAKFFEWNTVLHDVDLIRGIVIQVDNLTFHHVRIDDDATCSAICKESFFELQNVMMFAIKSPNKSLQRDFKFSSTIEPRAMDAIAGAINVTPADTLQADEHFTAAISPHLV